ncbi:hypothetical protein ACOSQ2_024166 [Xanthoceras sorbifolium]
MASHLKLLLLVAIFSSLVSEHSLSASVFLSIDCGTSETYKDENSISWIGDDTLISNGESKEIQYSSIASYPLTTLRVFKTRNKNCYNIKEVDAGQRVLVRASFLYGNYDEKRSPPVFDLHFDGNFWTTVNTSSWDVVSHEAIYVVKGNGTSICVAQTQPGQFPFISAIEVRSLGPKMYSQVDPNYALRSMLRAAWGANETTRDSYDRIWMPATGFLLTKVQNEAASIDVVPAENSPPPTVLKNAVTTSGTLWGIEFDTHLPKKPTPIYVATYYSEVSVLNSTDKRSFQVYIDEKVVSDPIIPPFGSASEVITTNRIASGSNKFSLRSTTDSTLGPLLNAMEIYTVTDPLSNGTNAKDVEGLGLLTSGFDVLKDWGGDPCLPSPYTWDWVLCTSDPIPRVTALNLSGYGLFGSLPDFSSMDALETIDLSHNSLTGQIQQFLGLFPSLTLLNLANNGFNGTIPTSLSKNSKLKLVVTGNCFNETSCKVTEPPSKKPTVPSKKSPPMENDDDLTETPPSQIQNGLPTSGNTKISNKLAIILGTIFQLALLFLLS